MRRAGIRSSNGSALLLLDAELETPPAADHVAYWSTVDVPDAALSIPALVEEGSVELRREYFAWVYELGNFRIGGRTIKEHLRLLPDFSFWWMTLIAEKEPLKSESIYVVLKLRALEKLCERMGIGELIYAGADRPIHATLSKWCAASGRMYRWIEVGLPRKNHGSWKRRLLPHPAQALGYLVVEWLKRFRIAAPARFTAPPQHDHEVTIATYFPNIDLERTRSGRFWSRYWEKLHELLDELPLTVNWLWIPVDSEQAGFREALRLRDICNAKSPGKYRHFVVDEFMSPRRVWQAIRYYGFLCWKGLRLRAAKAGFRFPGSSLNFYDVVRRDWRSSLYGIIAMNGAIFAAALDAAAARLPARPWGMVIWENQPWELMLSVAWRRHWPQSKTMAAQHSALRFLHLRSFADAREYDRDQPVPRPTADILIVNGSGARSLMAESGFPEERLRVAEALRYLDLAKQSQTRKPATVDRTLLVATGYLPEEVQFQVRLMERLARSGGLPGIGRIVVKPHPFCPVEPVLAAEATFEHEVVKRPLPELWPQADLAFVANSTSSVLEAMYRGVPVAVCAPDDGMNISPAFKCLPVPMISTAAQLKEFLQSPVSAVPPADYFALDEDLPRWRNLLDPRIGEER